MILYEGNTVIWRGDRIEWLLAQGFDEWWENERREGRAVIPQSLAYLRSAKPLREDAGLPQNERMQPHRELWGA